jgi:copper transport protein
MTLRFPIFIIFAIVLALPATVLPAYGHAVPVNYSLPPNTIIADREEVPQQILISFSERPDPKVSYIRVTDSQNSRIDNSDFMVTGGNNRQAAVTIDTARMNDGLYTVSWFTMSLDDGHITQGAYVFGVGDVSVNGGVEQETTYVTSYTDSLARWPLIVAQSAAVGMAISSLVMKRIMPSANPTRLAKLLVACSATIAISATGILFLQADNLVEAAGSYTAAVESLISDSPAGVVWAMRIGSAAVMGGLAAIFLFRLQNTLLYGVLAAGALSILSNSILSHNSAAPFLPEFAIAADWVHFMAVSAWVGGLFYFSSVLVPAARKLPDAARILAISLPRFSVVATISLGIIGVTGIYMAWIHLHSLDSLFTTEYGNILTVKLIVAVPMIFLGAFHQIRIHKGMMAIAAARGSNQGAMLIFRRTARAEALLGVGVLLAASLLTVTSPPAQTLASTEGYTHQRYNRRH